MKHIITILAIAFATVTLSSCTKKCDEYGLNCKVKSVLEQSYSAKQKFGEIDCDICVNLELLEFNNDRQMTSKSMFYDWGFKPGDDLELREKEIYKYNDQGLLIEKDEYNKDGDFTGKEVYKYNDQGLQTDEYSYGSKGDLWYNYHHEYDEDGNNTLSAWYDKDGSESWKWEKTYDSNHHELTFVHYEDGKMYDHGEYTWDGDNLISAKYYNHDSSVEEKTFNESDFFYFSKDENGLDINVSHEKWGNVTYEYVTFDKKGNWTKRYANDPKTNEVKYITERVITY